MNISTRRTTNAKYEDRKRSLTETGTVSMRSPPARLEAEDEYESVHGVAVHAPRDRLWIELLVDGMVIGPTILGAIADEGCGVADVVRHEGYLMIDVRVRADRDCDDDETTR